MFNRAPFNRQPFNRAAVSGHVRFWAPVIEASSGFLAPQVLAVRNLTVGATTSTGTATAPAPSISGNSLVALASTPNAAASTFVPGITGQSVVAPPTGEATAAKITPILSVGVTLSSLTGSATTTSLAPSVSCGLSVSPGTAEAQVAAEVPFMPHVHTIDELARYNTGLTYNQPSRRYNVSRVHSEAFVLPPKAETQAHAPGIDIRVHAVITPPVLAATAEVLQPQASAIQAPLISAPNMAATANLEPPVVLAIQNASISAIPAPASTDAVPPFVEAIYSRGIVIERHTGDGSWVEIARMPSDTVAHFDDLDVVPGQTYYYRAKYIVDNIESLWSEVYSMTFSIDVDVQAPFMAATSSALGATILAVQNTDIAIPVATATSSAPTPLPSQGLTATSHPGEADAGGHAPSLSVGVAIAATAAQAVVDAVVPGISIGVAIASTADAIAEAQTPTVGFGANAVVAAPESEASAIAPDLGVGQTVFAATTDAIIVAGHPPALYVNLNVTPYPSQATAGAEPPYIHCGGEIYASVATAQATAPVPTVIARVNISVEAEFASAALFTETPLVETTSSINVAPPVAGVSATKHEPAISGSANVEGGTAASNIEAVPAGLGLSINAPSGDASAQAEIPPMMVHAVAEPPAGVSTASANAPRVLADNDDPRVVLRIHGPHLYLKGALIQRPGVNDFSLTRQGDLVVKRVIFGERISLKQGVLELKDYWEHVDLDKELPPPRTDVVVVQRHSGDGDWTTIARTPDPVRFFDDLHVSPDETYYYRAKRIKDGIESEWSEVSPITFIDDYIILERHSGDGLWREIARVWPPATEFRDTDVVVGQTYYYRAQRVVQGVESDWSEIYSATFTEEPPLIPLT